MTRFQQMIAAKKAKGLHVCVGLDPEIERIPACIKNRYYGDESPKTAQMSEFMTEIALYTADIALATKPNWAFFEGEGIDGENALADADRRIRLNSPDLPFILDRKAADIGNTNKGTVNRIFNRLDAEAMTISPYMGIEDSMDSFLARRDKQIFILCLTSNKGAKLLQKRRSEVTVQNDGQLVHDWASNFGGYLYGSEEPRLVPTYALIAYQAAQLWQKEYGNVGLVVGATYPAELEIICRIVAGTGVMLLIPGSKTQGGRLEDIIPILKRTGCMDQAIVNLSRDIIYASAGEDYAEAAQKKLLSVNEEIDRLLG